MVALSIFFKPLMHDPMAADVSLYGSSDGKQFQHIIKNPVTDYLPEAFSIYIFAP